MPKFLITTCRFGIHELEAACIIQKVYILNLYIGTLSCHYDIVWIDKCDSGKSFLLSLKEERD